ncbi:MAG: branched-chain amino acid ABC transporter permease [Desulfatiglandaceae bacterium]|jgi:branched-chain amino acid transport system permease protein
MPDIPEQTGYLKRKFYPRTWITIGIALVVLHILPWVVPNILHIMIMIFLYTIMGEGWNVLGGYAGQFSFGHSVFFGIGAYVSTLLFIHFGLSPWFGIFVSCAAGIIFGLFFGFLSFRYHLKGPFFALIMLAFAEIFHMIAMAWSAVGGASGLLIPLRGSCPSLMQFISKTPFYFISLWLMLGSLFLVWWIEGTRMGLYFLATREEHDAAEALGVNTFKTQMVAMAISAGMTAIGGTIYAQYILYIGPDSTFGVANSVEIMLPPIIGGPGTVLGPLLGSALLTPLSEVTRLAFQSYSGVHLMIYGVVLVIVIMFLPNGILGFARKALSGFGFRGKLST